VANQVSIKLAIGAAAFDLVKFGIDELVVFQQEIAPALTAGEIIAWRFRIVKINTHGKACASH